VNDTNFAEDQNTFPPFDVDADALRLNAMF
jgi:hypothetical protein